jgi:N-acetylglutamate synthase-like GNAT family acetyltransferase
MPKLRPATSTDIPAVVALIDAAYRHYIAEMGGRRPRPMDDDQAGRVANGELFVLEGDGTTLGVITMQPQPEAIHIFNLAIHPDAQGRGLLHELIDFAEMTARREQKPKLTLYTNVVMTRNRAIYAHLGFTEIDEHDAPGGYRIVFMERPVA